MAKAADHFLRASALAPREARAHYEAGTALASSGEIARGVASLRTALSLQPSSLEIRTDLATALRLAGRLAEALPHFREVLQRKPDFALAHNNLGLSLLELREYDEAETHLRRAAELLSDPAPALLNLGNVLRDTGRVSAALSVYRKAIAARPHREAHAALVYAMMYDPSSTSEAICNEARRLCETHYDVPPPARLAPRPRSSRSRLRVGYVSADFREHVQALYVLPLLAKHDPEQFEVHLYSNVQVPDAITEQHRRHVAAFKSISSLDDDAAARLIYDDDIDVLVDLTMHMAHSRLGVFARRPAPLQLTWLAYPGTTGLAAFDYRLSDPHLDPPGTDHLYVEKTHRLPDSFWCFDPLADVPVSPLPAAINGYVTFGSLNNYSKTSSETFALWAEVLAAVPGSRLLLLAPSGSTRKRAMAELAREGIDPHRVDFVGFQKRVDYLDTYRRIDIVLDTIPYHGHTTSLDAWWMGVPVVSLIGTTVAGRAGLSQATNLGLERLCGRSPEQFRDLAVELADNLEMLSSLRAGLRERVVASPLMDMTRFARHLERAYRDLSSRDRA